MIATILIVVLVFLVARSVISEFRSSNPLQEEEKDETILAGKFTPHSLAKYNGSDSPRIFIAVKGRVFDVTQGATFYGPGGPYANFAGRDASRGLALNSFEESCLTPLSEPIDLLKDLSKEEKESLDNWEDHFESKYKVVGTLENE